MVSSDPMAKHVQFHSAKGIFHRQL